MEAQSGCSAAEIGLELLTLGSVLSLLGRLTALSPHSFIPQEQGKRLSSASSTRQPIAQGPKRKAGGPEAEVSRG